MIENKQRIFDSVSGDCFRACVTSILEVPNDDTYPNCDDVNWYSDWNKFLAEFGMSLQSDNKKIWRQGYWIAGVPSKNFKTCTHAIVMKGYKIAFDPSTKKRYRKGTNLLGEQLVVDGTWLEVTDPSLLHRFVEFKKKL